MQTDITPPTLNFHTEFSYLNTSSNERFLNQKIRHITYTDKDIISNGVSYEEEALYIILSGSVRVLRSIYGNNTVVSYDLGIGDIFGIETLINCGHSEQIPIMSSIGETSICYIHKSDLLEHLQDANVLKGLFNHYIKTINRVINPNKV